MTHRIRELARTEFWTLANRARDKGLDLAEVLDREGVLLTPQRHAEIQAQAFEHIAEMLETSAPSAWMPERTTKAPATLYDLQHGIVQALKNMAKEKRG